MQQEGLIATTGDSAIGERHIIVCNSVGEAWTIFCSTYRTTIINSFQATGLALPIDGSLDHKLSIKGFEPDNPLVIGGYKKRIELINNKIIETEVPIPTFIANKPVVESEEASLAAILPSGGITSVEQDLDINSNSDDYSGTDEEDNYDICFTAEVEEWSYQQRGTRTRPKIPSLNQISTGEQIGASKYPKELSSIISDKLVSESKQPKRSTIQSSTRILPKRKCTSR